MICVTASEVALLVSPGATWGCVGYLRGFFILAVLSLYNWFS